MADIINTPRGPKFFKAGSIRGRYFILPVYEEDQPVTMSLAVTGCYQLGREYYQLKADGEWHWSHTEEGHFQKYPCYEEPEWSLPSGV